MSGLTRESISVTLTFYPDEMRRRGKLGAAATHARHNGRAITAAARASFNARFEHEADPHGALPDDERAQRIADARRAYFRRLAHLSVAARRKPPSEITPTTVAA